MRLTNGGGDYSTTEWQWMIYLQPGSLKGLSDLLFWNARRLPYGEGCGHDREAEPSAGGNGKERGDGGKYRYGEKFSGTGGNDRFWR
jgi:hypothetical protein